MCCSNYLFLNYENLICRGTDILKCVRESLGIRDNERQLYMSGPFGLLVPLKKKIAYFSSATGYKQCINYITVHEQINKTKSDIFVF